MPLQLEKAFNVNITALNFDLTMPSYANTDTDTAE
jgi:hypothetical protein